MVHRSVVGCLLLSVLCLSPQAQALAVQASSSVVFVESAEWQGSSNNIALNSDGDGRNRLAWTLGGAALGAGIAWFGSALAHASSESTDDAIALQAAVIGAALGAVAGIILSSPASEEPAESSVLLVGSPQWQSVGVGLDLSRDVDSDNRLKGMGIGALAGGAFGLLVSERYRFLGPDQGTHVLAGALFGALAGFIISGPSPEQSAELSPTSGVRAYIPRQGGIGLAIDF